MESPQPQEGNPARRDDPSEPVAEADWPRLPRNAKKQLAKSCFVYVRSDDVYYCPQGRTLRYTGLQKDTRNGRTVTIRVYRGEHCDHCPLSAACRSPKARRGRMIYRDEYEPLREATAARMQTAEAQVIYARRMHGAETPFAYIKAVLGVRQFPARPGERADRMTLGVYGLQFEQTPPRRGRTARFGNATGGDHDNVGKRGKDRAEISGVNSAMTAEQFR